ncbi:CHAT domain-containing protein [Streptomyces sp. NPDC056909]|uniref:CHAT domain-containing protein n=1 Tax=Streptomyces sp. NPDC056909 TaxID=3345963 RepID=UPI0036BBE3C3
MADKPYDLSTLVCEIQQASNEGVTDGRDMGRMADVVLDHLGCATAAEAYDRLYNDWRALPRGTLVSGMQAGQVLSVVTMLIFHDPLPGRYRAELLREARDHGPADPRWQARIITLGNLPAAQGSTSDPAELEAALAQLEDALAMLPPGSPEEDDIARMHAGIRANLAQLGGGEDDFDSAVADLERLRDSPAFDEAERLHMDAQLTGFRMHQASRREDEEALAGNIRELESILARLSPDHMDRVALEGNLETARGHLRMLRERSAGRSEPDAIAVLPPLREVRRRISVLPRDARADRLREMGLGRIVHHLATGDHQGIVESMELLEEALDLLEPDDDGWIRCTSILGTVHYALALQAEVPHTDRSRYLDQSISWLKHSLRLAGGPEHPRRWAIGMALAWAYRARGDAQALNRRVARLNHAEARRVGLDTVAAGAWSVLLQSGTAHAAETGRGAGEQALDVARWCITDGAYDEAVRALDAGRGLVLHAATVAATVPDMLTALGQSALADEWRAAGAVVPEVGQATALTGGVTFSGPSSRLRRRVLQALTASPRWRRLLDLPSPGEIGEALRAMGRTALVYLVPGGDGVPGTALVVTAAGTVTPVLLNGLTLEASPLAEYRATGAPGGTPDRAPGGTPGRTAGRTAGGPPMASPPPQQQSPPDGGRAALERLCDWAGSAVMDPLLKELPRGWGRAPSVVLVPMAELGVVPWHAARLPGRRGVRRHACQEAEISYLPSARLLCEVAARAETGARRALVVGNPTRDLHHAGEEAAAIHRTFYPDGTLLGPGDATPAALTDRLRRQRGGVLHLACHGVVERGERHSAYLLLSGGRLAAEELTEGVARYRHLELVVLAACSTSVSGHGHDEAYSLSTAFLVAGARSVLGSLWPVPDEATSLLMYMTHHYMRREGQPPGRALRSAQLWMLNGGRQAPPGMPADMVARVPLIDADDLAGWAGFTHLGW